MRSGAPPPRFEIPFPVWQDEYLPFTLAHPAAVLPLRRTRLVFSALVIGSMAPDFPYFLMLTDGIRWGHSLRGVFLFCLPAGLLLLWLFHSLVKRPLLALAPEYVRVRVAPDELDFRFLPLRRFLLIVVSLLLGTFTHILWDGLTHDHGYFVKHWPWLSMPVVSPVTARHVIPLWRSLQLWCSVGGVLLIVAVTVWWWWRKPVLTQPVESQLTPLRRHQLLAAGFLLALAIGLAVGIAREGSHQYKWMLVETTIVTISALCAELLLFSLFWKSRPKEKPLDRRIQGLDASAER